MISDEKCRLSVIVDAHRKALGGESKGEGVVGGDGNVHSEGSGLAEAEPDTCARVSVNKQHRASDPEPTIEGEKNQTT
jgi:hypothetical protein